ncbi:hypothetical protein ACFQMJ_29095 [Cohnella cellulosilytica]|uniref:Uncharacterized protein n=2 Tax=Cohnella cellulosilytica TaxID=986710 RepID=A0ABW2FKJ7_9BACL
MAKLPLPEQQSSANPQASDNDEPESSSASEAPPVESGGPTEPSETSVETSTVHSSVSPEEPAVPNHSSFQAKSPSLAYLKLGYTDKDVIKRYGTPKDTYPLPDDAETIEIWEYDGLSVGLNERDKVVYIEIASKTVDTGIEKLDYGMKGAQAAELLGIPEGSRTNVLSLEVSGGWLKLDLDPDTQNVLALKLLDRNL